MKRVFTGLMLPLENKGTEQGLATAGVLLNEKIQSGCLGGTSLGPGDCSEHEPLSQRE